MTRQFAALVACGTCAVLLTGCAATMRTSVTTRLEQVQSTTAGAAGTLRVAPVTVIAAGRGVEASSLEIAPQLQQGSTSALRWRVAGRLMGGGSAHPALSASLEEGQVRTSELAGDTIAPLPSVAVLHVRQIRGGAAVGVMRGRRLQYTARLDLAQSQGLGESRASLPELASVQLEGRTVWHYTRRLTFGATLRAGNERVGTASALTITRLAATAQWDPARNMNLSAMAGLVSTTTAPPQPTLELGLSRGRPTGGLRLAASMALGPEVDRLSGVLTERRRTRVRVETVLVPRVSFGGTLQESADIGGVRQSVVRHGDAGLMLDLGRHRRLEIGVARFQQYSGGMNTNAETRSYLQFTFAPGR